MIACLTAHLLVTLSLHLVAPFVASLKSCKSLRDLVLEIAHEVGLILPKVLDASFLLVQVNPFKCIWCGVVLPQPLRNLVFTVLLEFLSEFHESDLLSVRLDFPGIVVSEFFLEVVHSILGALLQDPHIGRSHQFELQEVLLRDGGMDHHLLQDVLVHRLLIASLEDGIEFVYVLEVRVQRRGIVVRLNSHVSGTAARLRSGLHFDAFDNSLTFYWLTQASILTKECWFLLTIYL